VKNSEWKVYLNSIITTRINLADVSSTDGTPGSAEIRFRADSNGNGYSLTFRPNDSPSTISLRRSDTGEILQGREVSYPLPAGTTLFITLMADGEAIQAKIGTTDGGAEVADWSITDTTFPNKGCFWLVNNRLMDVRFDYFDFRPMAVGIQGTVKDSFGNLIGGVTVTANPGGYTAITGTDGFYMINDMNPGVYDLTASKSGYKSGTAAGIDAIAGTATANLTITDNSRAPAPTVTDAGAYQTSDDSITFSYSTVDPESPITEYWIAVSATPDWLDIIPGGEFRNVGLQTTHTRTGLSLENGQTYYCLAKARNAVKLMSANGASDGILIGKGVSTIPLAKAESNSTMIILEDKPVTASFPDCTYIEEPDRSSAIRLTSTGIAEGSLVDIAGYLSLVDGERRITPSYINTADTGLAPRPLGLQNKALGGGDLNALTPGITGGKGMNTIGLLVVVWGKVTSVGSGYFILDDGSCPLKVLSPYLPPVNTDVRVTGICTVESSGGTATRLLRARKRADIVP